jgi:hypothetical protein
MKNLTEKDSVLNCLKYSYPNDFEFASKIAKTIYNLDLNYDEFQIVIVDKEELLNYREIVIKINYINFLKWRLTLNMQNPQPKNSVDFSQIISESID